MATSTDDDDADGCIAGNYYGYERGGTLGAGAAFTILWGVADPMAAYAEVKIVEADGYYIMGDGPEENQAVAKERARADAKRAASEQAGIYVESIYEVKMSKLTRDEIRTISANVMDVQETEITPEVPGGTTIQYHCHIKARVDTSNIAQQLHQDRQQFEEAVRQNKELEQENARISAELATLKEKYKTATEAEKQEINREVNRNEDDFTAAKVLGAIWGFPTINWAIMTRPLNAVEKPSNLTRNSQIHGSIWERPITNRATTQKPWNASRERSN